MEEALLKLIKAIETAAPEVWRAAMMQVKAQIVSHAMIIIVELVVLLLLVQGFRSAGEYAEGKRDCYGNLSDASAAATVVQLVIGALAVGVGISMIALTQELIHLVMAPEWFAIQQLLDLVK